MEPDLYSILEGIATSNHLQREKAINKWIDSLKLIPSNTVLPTIIEQKLLSMFESKKWEERYGATLAATHLLCSINTSTDLKPKFIEILKKLMKDEEFRVRRTAGDALKLLIQKNGIEVYESIKECLLEQLKECSCITKEVNEETKKSTCRYLESSLLIFQKCIEGSGANFISCLNEEVVTLVEGAASHELQYIREIGVNLTRTLLDISSVKELDFIGPRFSPIIFKGMTDTWPQLRYAGCLSAKAFLNVIGTNDELKKTYYPILLPAICLNRYYNVEGIRIIALQTWKDTVDDKGRDYVLENIDKFVGYYLSQTKSKDALIKEAVCHCISELYTKVAVLDKGKIKEFIPQLLETLIQLMNDLAWEVRNAACAATAKLIIVTTLITIGIPRTSVDSL